MFSVVTCIWVQSYKLITNLPNNLGKKLRKNFYAAILRLFWRLGCMPKIAYCIFMYVRARVHECRNTRKKIFRKKSRKYLADWFRLCNFAPRTNL